MPKFTKLVPGRVKWIKFRFLCSHVLVRTGGAVPNMVTHCPSKSFTLPRGQQQEAPVNCLSLMGCQQAAPR